MEELEHLPVKHDIKKDHSKYVHTTVVEYPHTTVANMKKSWREDLEEYTEWLELFQSRVEAELNRGRALLEQENEKVKAELEESSKLPEEELVKKLLEEHTRYMLKQEEFVNGLEKRKEAFEAEASQQFEKQKQEIVRRAKQKKDALKLWVDK